MPCLEKGNELKRLPSLTYVSQQSVLIPGHRFNTLIMEYASILQCALTSNIALLKFSFVHSLGILLVLNFQYFYFINNNDTV
jgi:hypothetical protein